MATANYRIVLNQGEDMLVVIGISNSAGPVDVTGYRFLGQVKASSDPTAPIVAEFVFTPLDQSVAANKGKVNWSLSATVTQAMATSVVGPLQDNRSPTPYVYDVKMKDTSGTVSQIIQGILELVPEVTLEVFT